MAWTVCDLISLWLAYILHGFNWIESTQMCLSSAGRAGTGPWSLPLWTCLRGAPLLLILTLQLKEILKTHTPVVSWNIHESSERRSVKTGNDLTDLEYEESLLPRRHVMDGFQRNVAYIWCIGDVEHQLSTRWAKHLQRWGGGLNPQMLPQSCQIIDDWMPGTDIWELCTMSKVG